MENTTTENKKRNQTRNKKQMTTQNQHQSDTKQNVKQIFFFKQKQRQNAKTKN